jgi:hypothetical protein
MNDKLRGSDVVIDLRDRYERRNTRESDALAAYALDRCEEMFRLRAWDSFGYWHAIYVRQRNAPYLYRTSDRREDLVPRVRQTGLNPSYDIREER